MYEKHDVLTEVLERAKCDLTYPNSDKLPTCVPRGDLNIGDVLNAPYAFA
jgi:DNA-directed RNA polymerase